MKADDRAAKRYKARYGQTGTGSSKTREASEAEVLHHIEKIKRGKRK